MAQSITKLLLAAFVALSAGQLFAQDIDRKELIDRYAIEYLRSAGKDAALYHGHQQEPLPRAANNPYLNNNMQIATGRLSYNNILYPEVSLKFDLYRNELIITSPDNRDIVLSPDNVDFADLLGKHIIYFRSDSLPGCPSTGYYFLLNSGKCRVLEKRIASLKPYSGSNANQNEQYYYDVKRIFYLYKDGVYYTIHNEKSLLKVLNSYRKELKRYISSLQLSYKYFPDIVIALVVDEYEKLSEL